MEWIPWIYAGFGVAGAMLGWTVKLMWSKKYRDAKEAEIKVLKERIAFYICQWTPRFAQLVDIQIRALRDRKTDFVGCLSPPFPAFFSGIFSGCLFRRFQEPVGIGTAASLTGLFEEAVGNQLGQGSSHGAIHAVLGGGIAPRRMHLQATLLAELGQGEGPGVGTGLFGSVQPVDIEFEGGRFEGLDGGKIDIGHGRHSVFVVSDDYFSRSIARLSLGLIALG